jgi:predicted nucleic acid-binding Zn ribbon protein
VISEQFKSLNLNKKKMRKLCTHKVGEVKKKKKKKPRFAIEKTYLYFLLLLFGLLLWLLHFKDDL